MIIVLEEKSMSLISHWYYDRNKYSLLNDFMVIVKINKFWGIKNNDYQKTIYESMKNLIKVNNGLKYYNYLPLI